jgi:site-specific recombinase XerD
MTHGAAERLYAKETLAKHDDVFRSWLLPLFQGREVEDIKRSDVLHLRASMVNRGRSVYRQYSVLMTLKLWLKLCRNILDLECLDPAQIQLPNRKRPKVIVLSNHEVDCLRQARQVHTASGFRLRTLLEVLLGTGMRIGEVLALDREPFDFGAHELEIRSKGGRHRIIFFQRGEPDLDPSVSQYADRFSAALIRDNDPAD